MNVWIFIFSDLKLKSVVLWNVKLVIKSFEYKFWLKKKKKIKDKNKDGLGEDNNKDLDWSKPISITNKN